jgi:hypothetical protein
MHSQLLAWTNLELELTFHMASMLETTEDVPSVGNAKPRKAFLMLSTYCTSQTSRQKFQERERRGTHNACRARNDAV